MRFRDYLKLGFMAALFVGCQKEPVEEPSVQVEHPTTKTITPFTKTINNVDYAFKTGRVTQKTVDEDNLARIGVVSDIHGEIDKTRLVADRFVKSNVDYIVSLGDHCSNDGLRYGKNERRNDKEEIVDALEVLAQTKLPVFVIPGNHERVKDYEAALEEVTAKYENVIDMDQFRVFDGDDVDFVSLPGYQTFRAGRRQFIPVDGFYVKPEFIADTGKLSEGLDDAVVLVAHGAGKTNAIRGPATVYNGMDVGDENTRQMMKSAGINYAIAGNIHESGGLAATHAGVPVKQGEWSSQFTANFGGLEKWKHLDGNTYNGMAGVFTVDGSKAKFEMFYLE